MSADKRNFGLDGLRAVAILSVIFSHYFASTFLHLGGLIGVELFFVLSGFLIGGILFRVLTGEGSSRPWILNFWSRRWFRTLPNYYFFLIILTLESFFKGTFSFEEWILFPFFLQNLAWKEPGFFGVSWSLAVEEWFYLIFAATLFCGAKFSRFIELRWIEGLIILLFITMPLIGRLASSLDSESLRKIVVLRLDSLMWGVLAAWVQLNYFKIWMRATSPLVFFGGLILAALGVCSYFFHVGTIAALSFSFMSLGVCSMLPWISSIKKPLLIGGVVTFVSAVSYSAYLVHMPLFFWSEQMLEGTVFLEGKLKILSRVVLIGLVFGVSYLCYLWIELPFLKLRDRGRLAPSN